MALPSSGQINLMLVNSELGRSPTAQIGLAEGSVRNLAGVFTGTIAMSHLWGRAVPAPTPTPTPTPTPSPPPGPSVSQSFTLTAGYSQGEGFERVGYSAGYGGLVHGSLSPTSVGGYTIQALQDAYQNDSGLQLIFSGSPPRNLTMTINGTVYSGSSAYGSGNTFVWLNRHGFSISSTFTVVISW